MKGINWNNLKDASKEQISEAFITATTSEAEELIVSAPDKISDKAMVMASELAIKHSNIEKIVFLAKHNIFKPINDVKLIGFTNYVGQWSADLIKSMQEISGAKVIAIPLSKADTESPELLAIFNGFINPGAGDTFPGPEQFDISYMADGTGDHREHEYAYQNVINYAIAHNIPYLGICNGVQHLILNQGGSIAKADKQHNGVPHSIIMVPGTIAHFLALSKEEQYLALGQSFFEAMEFKINTQHNYAGVEGRLGSLELGGLSNEGAVEAASLNFYQYGFQFHPENMFQSGGEDGQRNLNLLQNTFNNFLLNKDKVDVDKVHQYLANALREAFANAQCYYDPITTPKADAFEHDVYQAAIRAGKRTSYINTPEALLAALKVEGNRLLMMAIAEDNIDLLNLALNNGIELDKQNFIEFTPHELAVMTGSTKCLDRLLKAKPLSTFPDGGYDLLKIAIDNNHEELALTLITKHTAAFHSSIDTSISTLHLAVIVGMPKVVNVLVNKGVDINKKAKADVVINLNSESANTEVSIAYLIKTNWSAKMILENLDLIDKLEDKLEIIGGDFLISNVVILDKTTFQRLSIMGADINAKGDYGRTALHLAVEGGNVEIVKLLIEKGADVNAKNQWGKTALSYAVDRGNVEIVKLLVEKGADVNAKGLYGRTALLIFADNGDVEMVKFLVENGADVNDQDRFNSGTALHSATQANNIEMVEFLLANGADVNAKDSSDKTALIDAARNGNVEMVKFLVENGADVDAKDARGEIALIESARNSNAEMVKFLVENGADVNAKDQWGGTALIDAAEKGNVEMVKFLVENGADVNAKDQWGGTALIGAAQRGNVEMVKFLVENGADVNAKTNDDGYTALIYAAIKGNVQMVEFLLEKGADVNAQTNYGETALILFAAKGDVEMVKFLVEKGADVNAKTNDGETALILFAAKGDVEMVKFLVEKGADVNAKDISGGTAFLSALLKGHFEIAGLIAYKQGINALQWLNQATNILPMADGFVIPPQQMSSSTTALTPLLSDASYGRAPYNMNNQIGSGTQSANAISNINYDVAGAVSTALYLYSAAHKNHIVDLTPKIMFADKEVTIRPYLDMEAQSLKIDEISKMKRNERQAALVVKYEGGNTILHLANAEEASQVLDIKGINTFDLLKQTNENGDTPLHIAVQSDVSTTKTMLKKLTFEERERVLTIRNNQNFTPLELAIQNNDVDMVKGIFSCVTDRHKPYVLAAVDKRIDHHLMDNGYKEMSELLKDYRAKHPEPSYLKQTTDLLSGNIR